MGTSRYDYRCYLNREVCLKSDLTPKGLRRFGIIATQAEIDAVYYRCYDGWILTGGHGHQKHTKVYSIEKLRSFLNHEKVC